MNDIKYRIGEFAKLSNISKRMLRHYDKLDLIKPIIIDESNGYRFYEANQLEQVKKIRHLQDFGFPLKEICTMLGNPLAFDNFMEKLKDREANLRLEQDTRTRQLLKLQHFIAYVENNPMGIEDVSDDTFEIVQGSSKNHPPLDSLERSISMLNTEMKAELYKVQNALGFNEHIDEAIEATPGKIKSFITLDIDKFLYINEDYGYDAGDLVIYTTFRIFKESFGEILATPHARLARLGGDEFAVFCVNVDKADIEAACKKTVDTLSTYDFKSKGINRTITTSIGITHMKEPKHYTELYHESTKALLQAKREGRNQAYTL